jgi:hypothetical protein
MPTVSMLPLGVTAGTCSHVFDLTDVQLAVPYGKWKYRGGWGSGLGGRNSSRGVIAELP